MLAASNRAEVFQKGRENVFIRCLKGMLRSSCAVEQCFDIYVFDKGCTQVHTSMYFFKFVLFFLNLKYVSVMLIRIIELLFLMLWGVHT